MGIYTGFQRSPLASIRSLLVPHRLALHQLIPHNLTPCLLVPRHLGLSLVTLQAQSWVPGRVTMWRYVGSTSQAINERSVWGTLSTSWRLSRDPRNSPGLVWFLCLWGPICFWHVVEAGKLCLGIVTRFWLCCLWGVEVRHWWAFVSGKLAQKWAKPCAA